MEMEAVSSAKEVTTFSALYVLEKGFMEFVDKENLSLIEHSHLFEKQEKCVYGVENDCFSIENKKMI